MPMSAAYRALYQRSIDDPAGFWDEQARRIDWQTPYSAVLDDARLPFARWFVGGRTNLCHNAIDRHLVTRGEQPGLVYVSTETGIETTYTSVSYTHLTLPTSAVACRSRWSPYH